MHIARAVIAGGLLVLLAVVATDGTVMEDDAVALGALTLVIVIIVLLMDIDVGKLIDQIRHRHKDKEDE